MFSNSNAMCGYRWSHPVFDVRRGSVRICCRTPSLPITGEDLCHLGPDALVNCKYLRERRLEMLRGVRHDDCNYCWNVESAGLPSPRGIHPALRAHFSALASQSLTKEAVDALDLDSEILFCTAPLAVEIQLPNLCDLKCIYCSRTYSNTWALEDLRYGVTTREQLSSEDRRPPAQFDTAMWYWIEQAKDEIYLVSFVGGEPLLQADLFRYAQKIERIFADRRPENFIFKIVTNLNTPTYIFARTLELIKRLTQRFLVVIEVSMEAFGDRAEYIRYGLSWSRFSENLEKLAALDAANLELGSIASLNALCISSLPEYLAYLGTLESRYRRPISVIHNLIDYPPWLSTVVLTADFLPTIEKAVTVALQNDQSKLPKATRYSKAFNWTGYARLLARLRNSVGTNSADATARRAAFWRGIDSLDARRGTNFQKIFPEYRGLLTTCKATAAEGSTQSDG